MGMVIRNAANDRELASDRESRKKRNAELAAQMINLRSLTHAQAGELPAELIELDPSFRFPPGIWEDLKYHEKQWLRVEAAARASHGAALAGRSAARRMGMWTIGPDEEPIELCLRSRGKSPSRASRPGYVYRRSAIGADELMTIDGSLLTGPERTFIDIARYHGFAEGLVAADYLLYRGYTKEHLLRQVQRAGRLRGIGTARRCIEHAVSNSDSPYESYMRALLIDAGVKPIKTQFQVLGYYADILVDNWLIIEIDGRVKYSGPDGDNARQREIDREKKIGNLGYVFLRFTTEELRLHPERCVQQVIETLASRGRLLAAR